METVRVRILTAFSLGGGYDVRPGDIVEMSTPDARRRLYHRNIELIRAPQEAQDEWDGQHGLLEPGGSDAEELN